MCRTEQQQLSPIGNYDLTCLQGLMFASGLQSFQIEKTNRLFDQSSLMYFGRRIDLCVLLLNEKHYTKTYLKVAIVLVFVFSKCNYSIGTFTEGVALKNLYFLMLILRKS